jgi:hypothetical protein
MTAQAAQHHLVSVKEYLAGEWRSDVKHFEP